MHSTTQSPREWAKTVAAEMVRQGKTIKSFSGSTGADRIESTKHEQRVIAEMRRLGAAEE